jgi:AraC family transcriptional regulator, regulatory protein of adaptative response / methylated-DNA-[protein]-cysteine methyltransferase
MTPTECPRDESDGRTDYSIQPCSLGLALVALSDRGVCAILLGDDADELASDVRGRYAKARFHEGDGAFQERVAEVIRFIEAPASGRKLPLDVRGTTFQRQVWNALQAIPAGATASYAEVARRIGKPAAVRAVAAACAANPLAIAIPCHRVLRADGSLSGYRWGVERKRALLRREGAAVVSD